MEILLEDRRRIAQELEELRALRIEMIDAQCTFRMQFARITEPVAYRNAQNEMEERNRAVETVEASIGERESQLEELDNLIETQLYLATENENEQTLRIEDIEQDSGPEDEGPAPIVDEGDEAAQNENTERDGSHHGTVALRGNGVRRRNTLAPPPLAIDQPVARNEAIHGPVAVIGNGVRRRNVQTAPALAIEQPNRPTEAAQEAPQRPRRVPHIDKHDNSIYEDFWTSEATKEWMEESEDNLRAQSRDANVDYQSFNTRIFFSRTEEFIAQKLFGVNEPLARRALNKNNFLMSYNRFQRRTVRNIRKQLQKIGGEQSLEIQAVPFVLRDDVEIIYDRRNSRHGCVFRVKCVNDRENVKFVDGDCRIYNSWKDFLTENKLPKAMMCYIDEGFLRRQGNLNPLREVPVKFCETPACSLLNRVKDWVTTGVSWLSPVASVLFFWNPIGWVGSAVTAFVLSYSIIGNVYTIYDKATHGEKYGLDVLNLITTLGTIVVQKALPGYLKSVAKAHRNITKLEKLIITSFLLGMSGSQVFSFIGTLYTFATKPHITALDVMNFVVACQNLYSCCISPKSAEAMLEQVRAELASEEFKKLTTEQGNEQKLKDEISELERRVAGAGKEDDVKTLRQQLDEKRQSLAKCVADQKLHQGEFQAFKSEHLEQAHRKKIELEKLKEEVANLQNRLNSVNRNGPDAAALKADLKLKQTAITQCEKEIISYQQQHQQEVKDKFKSDGAKEKCQEFIDAETNNRSPTRKIDENGRVIQAMIEMDAELVFTTADNEQSKIRFSNGEKLDLAINNQFDIHPRAIGQLNRISSSVTNGRNKTTDLERVFSKTRDFDASKMDKIEYLLQMREMLEPYGMISRAEIKALGDQMRNYQGTRWFSNSRFDKLPPAEALRLRSAMESVRSDDKGAVINAAELLAKNLNYTDSFRLADCIDIVNKTVDDKLGAFEQRKTNAQPHSNVDMVKICREVLNASDAEISQLQKENFSKMALRSVAFKQLSKSGVHSDSLTNSTKIRLQEVEATYFGDNSSHSFGHPLSAVCHEMEYGKEYSKKYANWSQGDRDKNYFRSIPKKTFSGKSTSLVSQDGMTITRTWNHSNGYFGKTTSSYAVEHDPNHPMHVPELWILRCIHKICPKKWDEKIATQQQNPNN